MAGRIKLYLGALGGHLLLSTSLACGDAPPTAPEEPEPAAPRLEAVGEQARPGAVGQFLPGDVHVRLVSPDGAPVRGARVDFRTAAEGGLAWPSHTRTDGAGAASVRWRLGDEPGPQVLRVEAAGADGPLEITASATAPPDVDALTVEGLGPEAPVGALVDGTASVGEADDFRFLGRAPVLPLGDWRGDGSAGGEVVVFIPGHGMLHRPGPGFTDGADTLRFELPEPVGLDLTVWLAAGPGDRAAVETALLTAARIFEREGLGATLRSVEFVEDSTVAGDLLTFRCSQRAQLVEAVGRQEGRINVYVVQTVDGSDSRGQACEIGGDFIALGRAAGSTLLAHEIGHNLSLVHVDSDPEHFDRTNVMHSASDVRESLSEGQILRAQLNAVSAVNGVFGHGDSASLRACFHGTSPECPPTALRLWADGGFGPLPAAGAEVPAPAPGPVPGYRSCSLDEGAPPASESDASWTVSGLPASGGWEEGEGGPPAAWVALSRREARRRARANARWLEDRGGPPPWLERVPREAVDPEAAAEAAERLLRRRWREGRRPEEEEEEEGQPAREASSSADPPEASSRSAASPSSSASPSRTSGHQSV